MFKIERGRTYRFLDVSSFPGDGQVTTKNIFSKSKTVLEDSKHFHPISINEYDQSGTSPKFSDLTTENILLQTAMFIPSYLCRIVKLPQLLLRYRRSALKYFSSRATSKFPHPSNAKPPTTSSTIFSSIQFSRRQGCLCSQTYQKVCINMSPILKERDL